MHFMDVKEARKLPGFVIYSLKKMVHLQQFQLCVPFKGDAKF